VLMLQKTGIPSGSARYIKKLSPRDAVATVVFDPWKLPESDLPDPFATTGGAAESGTAILQLVGAATGDPAAVLLRRQLAADRRLIAGLVSQAERFLQVITSTPVVEIKSEGAVRATITRRSAAADLSGGWCRRLVFAHEAAIQKEGENDRAACKEQGEPKRDCREEEEEIILLKPAAWYTCNQKRAPAAQEGLLLPALLIRPAAAAQEQLAVY